METMEAATETNASTEGVAVQYAGCHLLSDEEKMQLWASRPKEGDVVNGKADREKLREAIALLLPKGRQFKSTDHLKEFVLASAGPWGFHVNTHGTTHLVCARNPQRKYAVKAKPHDGEVRNRENVTKVDCPFIVRSSLVNGSRANKKLKKDDPGKDNRVSITDKCEFLHNAECCPGIESQTNARTNSGFYTRHHINTETLISVVKLIELGGVKPALLRAILRQHLPDNGPISATQLVPKKRRLEDDDEDTDVPLSQLMPKKKAKEKPATYGELLTLSTNLSNAAGGKKDVSNLVGAALLAITRIVQGHAGLPAAQGDGKSY
jgi:hypothetical protein